MVASLSSCPSAVGFLDASGLAPVHADAYKQPSIAQMPPISEESHGGADGKPTPWSDSGSETSFPVDSEVQDLWKVVKELQKGQEDMLQSFQRYFVSQKMVEERLDAIDSEMVEIRQKVFCPQELTVTDALDYAETEVQDLRASLEKIHEHQALESAKVQRQQVLLREQMKQVKSLQTSHKQQCAEVQQILQQRAKESPGPMDKLEASSPRGLCSLRAQVDIMETRLVADLETRQVAEQSRMARKECEKEHALQTLQSRIDAWEVQQKCVSSLDAKCEGQVATLQDLQATVNRQLEEYNETVADKYRGVLWVQSRAPQHCTEQLRPHVMPTAF